MWSSLAQTRYTGLLAAWLICKKKLSILNRVVQNFLNILEGDCVDNTGSKKEMVWNENI